MSQFGSGMVVISGMTETALKATIKGLASWPLSSVSD